MTVLTQQDNVRFHTVKILTDFDRTGERLSTVSSLYFGENKKISHPEELTYLVQEITRWRAYLDGVIDSIYRGKYSKVGARGVCARTPAESGVRPGPSCVL